MFGVVFDECVINLILFYSSTCLKMVNLKSTSHLLEKLRALMKSNKFVQEPIQAYIVPSEDRHQVFQVIQLRLVLVI